MADRMSNVDEVFPKLARDILISGVFLCQLQCDGQQVEGVHCHPTGPIRLFDMTTGGKGCVAIEHADVVQTQKSALENVSTFGILAVYPPGEIQHQLVEHPLQECAIRFAMTSLVDFVHTPRSPSVHRWID